MHVKLLTVKIRKSGAQDPWTNQKKSWRNRKTYKTHQLLETNPKIEKSFKQSRQRKKRLTSISQPNQRVQEEDREGSVP